MNERLPENKSSTSSPRKNRLSKQGKWFVAAMIAVILASVLGRSHIMRWFSPPYVVTAGEASYHFTDLAPRMTINIACNRHRSIAYSRLIADSITDDQGRDLMGGPFDASRAARDLASRFIMLGVSDRSNGNEVSAVASHWHGPVEASSIAWTIQCRRRPSPGAKNIHFKGRILLWEGGRTEEHTVKGVELKPGVKFEAGGCPMEIIKASTSTSADSTGSCTLKVSDPYVVVESVRPPSDDWRIADYCTSRRLPCGNPDCLPFLGVSFDTPPLKNRVDLTIKLRRNPTIRTIPVDPQFAIHEGPDKNPGMFGPGQPSLRLPAVKDWGEVLPTDWPTHTRILAEKARRYPDPCSPSMHVPLRFERNPNHVPISVHLRLEQLQNECGIDLLRPERLSSDAFRWVYVESYPAWSGPSWSVGIYGMMPSLLHGRGTYRVAYGEDETTETVPGNIETNRNPAESLLFAAPLPKPGDSAPSEPSCGTPFKAGAVTFFPRRVMTGAIEFKVTGNLGLVRELAALDADGHVLTSEKIPIHCFDTKECWYYFGDGKNVGKIRSWRVTYFRKCRWIDRRFEFATDEIPCNGR